MLDSLSQQTATTGSKNFTSTIWKRRCNTICRERSLQRTYTRMNQKLSPCRVTLFTKRESMAVPKPIVSMGSNTQTKRKELKICQSRNQSHHKSSYPELFHTKNRLQLKGKIANHAALLIDLALLHVNGSRISERPSRRDYRHHVRLSQWE